MVKLAAIDKSNWRKVAKLQVQDDQNGFVAYNWYSMLEAIFDDWGGSVAIINEDDEIVGYSMYGAFAEQRLGYICRFMIDKNHQRKGYGREAMRLIMTELSAKEGVDVLKISVVPENAGAKALYESLGFVHKGEVDDGELVLEMPAAAVQG